MADIKHQIDIKPRSNQNIPKVLQKLMQKQIEAAEDSQDSVAAAVVAKGSGVENITKSATLEKGIVFSESTDRSVVGSERGVATLPNHYKFGQGRAPPASTPTTNSTKQQDSAVKTSSTNSTKQQDSGVKTAAVARTSPATKTYIKTTNQSVDQRQFTKQTSNSNLVDKVIHNSAQIGETKPEPLNKFSRINASTTILSSTTPSSSLSSSSSSSSSTQQTPSPTSNDDGAVINFRSALRPVRNSVLSEIFDKSTTNSTPGPTKVGSGHSQNVEAKTSPPASSSAAAAERQVTHTPWKTPGPSLSAQTTTTTAQSSNNQPQGHNNKSVLNSDKRGRSDIVCRDSDRKQFKRVSLDILSTNLPAPRTSKLPNNIDLTEITLKYLALLGNIHKSPKTSASDEPGEPVEAKPTQRDSLINEISAEDEGATVYDDGYSLSPTKSSENEEFYMDGESEKQADGGTGDDDVYEEAVMMTDSQEVKARKQLQKMMAEAKKKEEKEKKEKEKEEKRRLKDEKMKIKKEKERIQQHKQFNLTGHEVIVGQGVMKQDVKEMSLKQGQTVTIIRLDKNPVNMWLISSEAGLGYVNSAFIEVDTAVIREAMNHVKKSSDGKERDSIYDVVEFK
ncbi:hypothetical protein BsWGS_20021 [Bradybaena similaris]